MLISFSLSAACHLLSKMVTGAAVFFLALCLFATYQNKYDLIRIQIWPCLPSPQYLQRVDSFDLLGGGIEIWVPPGHSLGPPRSCSLQAAESHYGLMIWAARLTSVTLDGFSCDCGVPPSLLKAPVLLRASIYHRDQSTKFCLVFLM